jgi:hypothetical protein
LCGLGAQIVAIIRIPWGGWARTDDVLAVTAIALCAWVVPVAVSSTRAFRIVTVVWVLVAVTVALLALEFTFCCVLAAFVALFTPTPPKGSGLRTTAAGLLMAVAVIGVFVTTVAPDGVVTRSLGQEHVNR